MKMVDDTPLNERNCANCIHFLGFDGIGELWTGCTLFGDFKGTKKDCNMFKSRKDVSKEKDRRLLKRFQYYFNEILDYHCDCMSQKIKIDDDDIESFLKEE